MKHITDSLLAQAFQEAFEAGKRSATLVADKKATVAIGKAVVALSEERNHTGASANQAQTATKSIAHGGKIVRYSDMSVLVKFRSCRQASAFEQAILAGGVQALSAAPVGPWSLGEITGNWRDIDIQGHGGVMRIVWKMEDDAGRNEKLEAQAHAVVAALNAASPTPPAERWNPLDGGNPETALQLAAVIAHRDAQQQPSTPDGEPSNVELRGLWYGAGGSFHGPSVETGTMPEAKLLPFLRELRNQQFNAGRQFEAERLAAQRAQAAPKAAQGEQQNCGRCSGSGEDPAGYYDQSRGDAGSTFDGPCRECNGTGAAPQQEAQEPVLFLSPGQLAALTEPDGAHGRYLPVRKTRRGMFTMPLYTAPQPAPAELEQLKGRIGRIGLDIDRALHGQVNEQSPVGAERLAAIAALAKPAPAAKLLTKEHQGMRVDYSGLLGQCRRALHSREPANAEMLRQLQGHLQELGRCWYAGETVAVDEFLQLYCIEHEARAALAAQGGKDAG